MTLEYEELKNYMFYLVTEMPNRNMGMDYRKGYREAFAELQKWIEGIENYNIINSNKTVGK